MAEFKSLDEAAKGLLISTAAVLNDSGVEFAIAGGWVPVLAAGPAGIVHPGTRDVDVLLSDDEGAVQAAAKALLDKGYYPSAKHEFQLLRQAKVGEREFVFNVDLMHPAEAERHPELYSDIIDLGVNDAYDPTGKRWVKSIAFKSAAIVFEQKMWWSAEVSGSSFDELSRKVDVPLLTPAAFILSKCKSVAVEKRTRDAFDLYYVLNAPDAGGTSEALRDLCARLPQVQDQVGELKAWLSEEANAARFNHNVSHHARREISDAAHNVLRHLA